MNKKKFTLSMILMLFSFVANSGAEEKNININGGETMFGNIPEFTKWYYYSFAVGDTIGSSLFAVEEVGDDKIKTEIPDAGWAARDDWDIAFHATDIRTNGLKAVLIADTTSAIPLDEVYVNLKNAPSDGYAADAIVDGRFIYSMAGMPPLYVGKLSVCLATNGWATYGMGVSSINSMVVVFEKPDGKYVKLYLKEFYNEEGHPGYIKLEYEEITLEGGSGNINPEKVKISVFPNPATDVVNVVIPDSEDQALIEIFSISGELVKQAKAFAGVHTIPVSGLSAGMYIVKVGGSMQKFIVK